VTKTTLGQIKGGYVNDILERTFEGCGSDVISLHRGGGLYTHTHTYIYIYTHTHIYIYTYIYIIWRMTRGPLVAAVQRHSVNPSTLATTIRICGAAAANGPTAQPQCDTWVNMEQRWNDIDRGQPKDSENNLSICYFVRHKSHTECPGRESGSPRRQAGD
jgi:hypothetical protein